MASRMWIPYFVLAVVLTTTITSAFYVHNAAEAADKVRFETRTLRIQNAISQRLETYTAMLLGGKGLFAAVESVSRDGFREYVERLDLRERYPGIQGIGYSARLRPEQLDAALSEIRRDFLDFRVWPEGPRPEYHTIVYLEPLDRRNRAALGYDMFAEPVRRQAMQRAADTGLPAMSGKVTLVQEIDDVKQAGFLIYVPLYLNDSIPHSPEERRELLLGFIYSPFRADDFLRGLQDTDTDDVDFQVYDETPAAENLLHTSNGNTANLVSTDARFQATSTIDVGGRIWTLAFASRPEFALESNQNQAIWILFGGGALALTLFTVIRSQTRAHEKADQRAAELRKSEQALLQSVQREQTARREAESASQMKDEFLATISHELRTPLTPMLGWVHILRRQLPAKSVEAGLDVIERNIQTQLQLIDDLLDVSRIITGKLRLKLTPISIRSVLSNAVESVRPQAAARQITVETAIDSSSKHTLADPGRLQQIVMNLLSNSLKFTPQGGKIRVELNYRDDQTAQIVVSDTGSGMSPHFLPYAFDRFQQADGGTTRVHGGLGLGLSIVRSLVELHGGSVEARSEGPNQGSTFTVILPMRDPSEQTTPVVETERESISLSGTSVLIVEDEADSRDTFAASLLQYGAKVRTAAAAAEALEILESYRPDVLVSDIAMPGMDGMEMIRKVRATEHDRGLWPIPAIALTAHAREEDRDKILASGFQLYLPKPILPSQLASAVNTLLER